MKISTKGRYALRMLLDLAEHQSEGYIALKDIAARQDVSKNIWNRSSRSWTNPVSCSQAADFRADTVWQKHRTNTPSVISYVQRREVCHRLPVWTMSRYSVREPTCARHFPYGKDWKSHWWLCRWDHFAGSSGSAAWNLCKWLCNITSGLQWKM